MKPPAESAKETEEDGQCAAVTTQDAFRAKPEQYPALPVTSTSHGWVATVPPAMALAGGTAATRPPPHNPAIASAAAPHRPDIALENIALVPSLRIFFVMRRCLQRAVIGSDPGAQITVAR
ncbi:hypothetical protein [Leifsonia sp. LS-T14]|uniref:hypothetical protein n=1 Tax=unclassified Leifsonia TaxID=2663824 RepID=UPI0035A620F9